jgi:hypothetical protein
MGTVNVGSCGPLLLLRCARGGPLSYKASAPDQGVNRIGFQSGDPEITFLTRSSSLRFKHELLLSAVPNKIWCSGSSPSMWSEDRRSSRRWRRSSSSGGAGRVGADWVARPRGREWGLGLREGSRSVAQGSAASPLTLGFGRFGTWHFCWAVRLGTHPA